jgi:endonuclease/exonuclease/phosphatase family metal-dependent hydrolase
MTDLRILNLNIWNYNEPWIERRARIVELIQETEPDVVALQEIRYHDRLSYRNHQADQILTGLSGYRCVWHPAHYWPPGEGDNRGGTCWEGLAILSRYPIVDQAILHLSRDPSDSRDSFQRLVMGARVQTPGGPFWLFNTHYPLSADARDRVVVETLDFVEQTAGELSFALSGDLNAVPEHLPIRFLSGQTEIGGRRSALLDVWTVCHPGEPGYTFPAWEPSRRIDYLFVASSIEVVDVSVVGSVPDRKMVSPSDHCGLLADLRFPRDG